MREEIDFYDFLFFLRRANFRHIFILNYVGNSYTQITIKQLKTRLFKFRKNKLIAIWYSFNISKVKKKGRTPPNRVKCHCSILAMFFAENRRKNPEAQKKCLGALR